MNRLSGWCNGFRLVSGLVLVALFAHGWHLTDLQARHSLEEKAARSAHIWLGYFSTTVDDFDTLLQTGAPTQSQLRQLTTAKDFANAFRFKLFDATGNLTLLSDHVDTDGLTQTTLSEHNPAAFDVLTTLTPFIAVEDGRAKPNRPDTYAEIYLPVVKDGAPIGVIEVYVDVSEAFVATERAFAEYAAILAALMIAAMCVPSVHLGIAWRRLARTNQLLTQAHQVAERMRREQEWQALHDGLTRLPNRRYNDREMTRRIAAGGACALVRIDLDHFKNVNDTLGHAAGDAVLKRVAQVLNAHVGADDFAARTGGDEFSLCLGAVSTEQEALELVKRVQADLAEPLYYDEYPCRFGASIGIAFADELATVGKDIQLFADAAMYSSKSDGRNQCSMFTPSLHRKMLLDRQLAKELQVALERSEFVPVFQPQVSARDGHLVGAEALLRWQHPDRGLIEPSAFLGVAEQLRIVHEIDRMIMVKSRQVLERWRGKGLILPKVSFNVSAERLRQKDLIATAQTLQTSDTKVALELLESILIEDEADLYSFHLDLIRDAGIEIEIDDFGSGHASIVGVMEIRPSALKIDQRIISPIHNSDEARKLAGSIIEIAGALGIKVTAEGVETTEQARILRDLGCDTLQGFLFAKPLDEMGFLDNVCDPKIQIAG